ncbi:MAG: MATE family efflux transporter, partial [Xanthomonadaceae bacterium]|nr:MATE family efflux transporter [Xanthomonadaceae bacterium]
AFMVPLGLAGAISVRVGNALGRSDPAGARLAGLVGIGIAGCFGVISATFMWLFPEAIARIYSHEPDVIDVASRLLLLAAVFQVSDGLQAAAAGALRGSKDTRMPMLYSVFSYWAVGLSIGWWLTFAQGWGASGMWVGLIAGLSVAAVLLGGRFWRTSRRWDRARPE